MALKANYEFLFVGKDENSFLENYAYDLYQQFGDKSGEVFINLEIQNNPVDAEEIAAAIFETMQKVFFEDVGRDAYTRFEVALKAVNTALAQFKTQKSSGYIGNLNVVIAAIVDDELLLTQSGEAEAYLIRKRYVSIVSEGLNEDASGDDVFASIASGKIEVGDTVLFATTRLVRYLSKNDLAECVHRRDISESLADLRDRISAEILGRVGLTAIGFTQVSHAELAALDDELDRSEISSLESDGANVSSKKSSLTGKFFTAIKNYKDKKSRVWSGDSDSSGSRGGGGPSWYSNIFGGGIGKNKVLILLVGVILLLGVIILFASSNRAEKAKLEELNQTLETVKDKISEAETKGSYDKEQSKQILDKAYVEAKGVLDSGYFREKATMYLLQIEETRDKLDNLKRIENPKVVADLTAKRSDVSAIGFANVGDKVYIYEYNALYELVLDQLQDPVTIDDKEQVVAATGFDDRGSVVFLTKSGKLIEYREGTVSFMDSEEGGFKQANSITDWGNKIYLLDASGGQIWRYAYKASLNKFGAAEGYITDKTDIAKAVDVAIDASVYVLSSGGDILKFYGGSKAEFFINNPPFVNLQNPIVIHTDEKLDNVYVVDGKESRVLVFQKDAQSGNVTYKEQYLFPTAGEIRDVYVNPDSKKLYILTPSKVLEVDI